MLIMKKMVTRTATKFKAIYEILYAAFGPQHWWPAKTPFEMMVGAILTQNTSWTNVEKAINNFKGNLSPKFVLDAQTDIIANIIKPSGYYNQKAKRLKYLSEWFKKYDFDVANICAAEPEKIRNELLSVSGIGHETADSILLYAFNFPFFVVDAYTRRIFKRIGFDIPDNYEDIRMLFEENLERDSALYGEYHALIVRLAKENCKKVPNCLSCPLKNICSHPSNP